MVVWVFDLDNTIYNTSNVIYDQISKDNYLHCLINNLDGPKFVFTNATMGHARMVLSKLGIEELMDDIIDRNAMGSLKPHNNAFQYFIRHIQTKNNLKIMRQTKFVFFEDNIDNLVAAKIRHQWTTVLISKYKKHNRYVDFIYKDIHSAIESFSFNPGKCFSMR